MKLQHFVIFKMIVLHESERSTKVNCLVLHLFEMNLAHCATYPVSQLCLGDSGHFCQFLILGWLASASKDDEILDFDVFLEGFSPKLHIWRSKIGPKNRSQPINIGQNFSTILKKEKKNVFFANFWCQKMWFFWQFWVIWIDLEFDLKTLQKGEIAKSVVLGSVCIVIVDWSGPYSMVL